MNQLNPLVFIPQLIDKAGDLFKSFFAGQSNYTAPGVKEAVAVLADRSRIAEQSDRQHDSRLTLVEHELADTRAELRELKAFLKGFAWAAAIIAAIVLLRGHF